MNPPFNILTKKIKAGDLFSVINQFSLQTPVYLSMHKIDVNGKRYRWSGLIETVSIARTCSTSYPAPKTLAGMEVKVTFAGEDKAWAMFMADKPVTVHILTNDLGDENDN